MQFNIDDQSSETGKLLPHENKRFRCDNQLLNDSLSDFANVNLYAFIYT